MWTISSQLYLFTVVNCFLITAAWFIVGKTAILNPRNDLDYIDDATTPKLPDENGRLATLRVINERHPYSLMFSKNA